jgi:hypothetical protein
MMLFCSVPKKINLKVYFWRSSFTSPKVLKKYFNLKPKMMVKLILITVINAESAKHSTLYKKQ